MTGVMKMNRVFEVFFGVVFFAGMTASMAPIV
jgi:hypothetical protein